MRIGLFRTLVLALGGTVAGNVFAGGLAAGSTYNVVTFGDFQASGDTGGSLAVGGNMFVSGYNVAQNPINPATFASSAYALVLGGKLTGATSIASGSAWIGTALTAGNEIYLNGTGGPLITVGGTPPFDFAVAKAALSAQSAFLANQTSNGYLSITYGTVNIGKASDPAGTYYVTLTADQLAMANSININFAAGSTIVINLVGCASTGSACITMPNGGFTVNGGGVNGDSTTASAREVLFNMNGASTVALNGSVMGTILAPSALVKANASIQLDGQLIAQSFKGPVDSHDYLFQGNIPNPVPEPSTFGVMGLGLIGLIGFRKLRRG